jgi:hypothetical protein
LPVRPHKALSPDVQIARSLTPVGEDLLDDGVVAVMFLGLDHLERAVGNTAW